MEDEDFESLPAHVAPSVHMAAGALAGIAEHTLTYPLDSIKTRMQVLRPHPTAIYRGVLHAASSISTQEGLGRLWRGVLSVVIGAGPAHAIYFAAYEQAKSALLKDEAGKSPLRVGLAGGIATALSDAVMTPFDVIKQRMQMHGSSYRSVLDCAMTTFRTEGLRAFYLSYPATLLLNVPFHMTQFPVYEAMRRLVLLQSPLLDGSPIVHIASGAVAGGTAALLTTPIDVIKTTLQTTNTQAHVAVRNTADAIGLVFKEHGFKGFFRGAVPRMLTYVPSTAICWSVYEYFKQSFVEI